MRIRAKESVKRIEKVKVSKELIKVISCLFLTKKSYKICSMREFIKVYGFLNIQRHFKVPKKS
jgi:hypothetical protein